jgi:epoxyqueuosine reductase QueG
MNRGYIMKELNTIIQNKLKAAGASLVGFADLSSVPAEARDNLRYGIAYAIAVEPKTFLEIEKLPNLEYYTLYKDINKRLSAIGQELSDYLIKSGCKAKPLTPALDYDEKTLSTQLPIKTVAVLAGLGWIGKPALLVTKEYGSAVRLSAVLTDAELDICKPQLKSNCGSCNKCLKVCPGEAISGTNWSYGTERSEFFDAFRCADACREQCDRAGIDNRICGKCIAACPWTKRYIASALN